jgi:hypothetical protein
MSDSVAEGSSRKFEPLNCPFRMVVLSFYEGIVYSKCVQRRTTQNSGIHGVKASKPIQCLSLTGE